MSCSQGDEFEGVSFTRFPVTQGAAAELTVARLQVLMNPLWHMGLYIIWVKIRTQQIREFGHMLYLLMY